MITWAERAKAAILQMGQKGTAKTDETTVIGLSAVSSVPAGAIDQTHEGLLSVLAVPASPKFEKCGIVPAANDPASTTVVQVAISESGNRVIDSSPVRPPSLLPTQLAASLALDASIAAGVAIPIVDPDGACWPHSTAMNEAEVDLFAARLLRFNKKGLTHTDSEALADRLVIRDRDGDDRTLCLECVHLNGHAGGSYGWHCTQRKAAHGRSLSVPIGLVTVLQRCDHVERVG